MSPWSLGSGLNDYFDISATAKNGSVGGVYDITGSGGLRGYITAAISDISSGGGIKTLSAWVNTSTSDGIGKLFAASGGTYVCGMEVYKNAFRISSVATGLQTVLLFPTQGQWYFFELKMDFDSGTCVGSIDGGADSAAVTMDTSSSVDNIRAEMHGCTGGGCVFGNFYIDDISIDSAGAPATDSIVFTNPEDSEALISDFISWQFNYTLANATSNIDIYYGVTIDYTASSTGASYSERLDSYIPAEGQSSGSISTRKDNLLTPDGYSATATFYSIDLDDCTPDPEAGINCQFFDEFASSTLASSSINFSIGGFAGGIGDPFNSTSTIQDLTATCDSSSGLFASSLCKMMITVFVPSSDSVEQFDGVFDLIQTKPPIGYFTQFRTALNSYASSSLPTATFSFNASIAGFSPISTLRTAFGWIFWLVFGFWVFHRLRHFDFHL